MKTIAQIERKYTELLRVRGEMAHGFDEPMYIVKMRVGAWRFQAFPAPLDAKTARWMRTNVARALYKLVALETARPK